MKFIKGFDSINYKDLRGKRRSSELSKSFNKSINHNPLNSMNNKKRGVLASIEKRNLIANNSFEKDRKTMLNQDDKCGYKSIEDGNFPLISNPSAGAEGIHLSPSKKNITIAKKLNGIIEEDTNRGKPKSKMATRPAMKNWFKQTDPSEFSKRQTWYLNEVDKFIKSGNPVNSQQKNSRLALEK